MTGAETSRAAPKLISVGECMVELSRRPDGTFSLAFGGDTFNTAVYAARLGIDTQYVTALGDDPYSDGIVAAATADGVGTGLIARCGGRMPGLYLIETRDGERTFWYWRERSPARDLFELPHANDLAAAFALADLVYFSGITLSLYSPAGLDRFADTLLASRAGGTRIAMDSNYRPRGWPNGRAHARSVFERFWRIADIALPTFDDEAALWDEATPGETVARLTACGATEIVVKNGADGAWTRSSEYGDAHLPCPAVTKPVDTTAAGDSFNAAYVSARLKGLTVCDATVLAHRLAAVVIGHRGAIAPQAATDALTAAFKA